MSNIQPQPVPEHTELIVHCIGVAALEIQQIADPKRRARVARNAVEALKDCWQAGSQADGEMIVKAVNKALGCG